MFQCLEVVKTFGNCIFLVPQKAYTVYCSKKSVWNEETISPAKIIWHDVVRGGDGWMQKKNPQMLYLVKVGNVSNVIPQVCHDLLVPLVPDEKTRHCRCLGYSPCRTGNFQLALVFGVLFSEKAKMGPLGVSKELRLGSLGLLSFFALKNSPSLSRYGIWITWWVNHRIGETKCWQSALKDDIDVRKES